MLTLMEMALMATEQQGVMSKWSRNWFVWRLRASTPGHQSEERTSPQKVYGNVVLSPSSDG